MNNGCIPFSHREARLALGIGNTKTARAFKQAQEHGFLIIRSKGSFDYKVAAGEGRATEWEISTEACDEKPAKQGFKNWKKQTPVPDAGTAGSHLGNRSSKTTTQNSPDGSQSGNRYGRLRVVNGS